ncbi:hypothetical protein CDAR_172461 [Caerostris darwini]|uniref:Uncharacterized protein n=1 Tax=Caerostris darwini TaxID=1538125 RepID=A0AAV4MEP6_9ARAC|nr:hypothetical protein CDAR_172461 [Caerostris darwini]
MPLGTRNGQQRSKNIRFAGLPRDINLESPYLLRPTGLHKFCSYPGHKSPPRLKKRPFSPAKAASSKIPNSRGECRNIGCSALGKGAADDKKEGGKKAIKGTCNHFGWRRKFA